MSLQTTLHTSSTPMGYEPAYSAPQRMCSCTLWWTWIDASFQAKSFDKEKKTRKKSEKEKQSLKRQKRPTHDVARQSIQYNRIKLSHTRPTHNAATQKHP